jgi:hypothetical protein
LINENLLFWLDFSLSSEFFFGKIFRKSKINCLDKIILTSILIYKIIEILAADFIFFLKADPVSHKKFVSGLLFQKKGENFKNFGRANSIWS